MRPLAAALLLGVLLTLAGCGEDEPSAAPTAAVPSSSRPAISALADALRAEQDGAAATTYTAEEATCIASVLHASELSDDSLRSISESLASFAPTGEQESIYRTLIMQVAPCLSGRLTTATPAP